MAAAEEAFTPTSYISHHLTFFTKQVGDGSFWTLNVDSLVVAAVLGIVGMGFFWWIVRNATPGVPNKRQAFVELAIEFVDNQVKGIFHGDRHKFIAPTALTVFVWVLLMNAMDFLPIDIMAAFYEHVLHVENWHNVPTADVNTTFALALSVSVLSVYFAIAVKGFGGWIHELFCAPFGSHFLLWPSSSMFPSRCRTLCACSATCTRVRSSSFCYGSGQRRGWPAPCSPSCLAGAGPSSIF